MTRTQTRVAVIGAGATGLAQLKQLLDTFSRSDVKSDLEVVVFESREDVGGTWLFHPDKPYVKSQNASGDQLYFSPPENQDPSPMYEGLVTNLPIDLMAYRDLPATATPEAPFPDRATILRYLHLYAKTFDLRPHIRLNTLVTRLYQGTGSARRWTVESKSTSGEEAAVEEFDYVSVTNGHYSDPYVPEIPGLALFPGEVLHSRFYTRPEDYAGRTVLVVGSFASGSDLSRQLAALNIGRYAPSGEPLTPGAEGRDEQGYTKVYLSTSGAPNSMNSYGPNDPPRPWQPYITNVPIISHIIPSGSHGEIHFSDTNHAPVTDVDVIIFATGYNCTFPFCKAADAPWKSTALLDRVIAAEERVGARQSDIGGLKGLEPKNLDELMLFLDGDRSIAFPAIQYQIVPFPFAEAQGRLTARLWAGLLPSFPDHPTLPPNASNPYWTPPPTPSTANAESKQLLGLEGEVIVPQPSGEIRKNVQFRKKLVFGDPYEWTYTEYLFSLMAEAGETEEVWRKVEQWRKDRRADKTLRQRTLGW